MLKVILFDFVYFSYCVRWVRHFEVWMDGPFEYLLPVFVEEAIENYSKEFLKMQKAYRNRIKQDMIGAPVCKFKVRLCVFFNNKS